jgi:hypothetical protein
MKSRMLVTLLFSLVPLLVAATPLAQANPWRAEYFANPTLSGAPALSRSDQDINFDWGGGSPGAGIPADNFSVRWTRDAWFDDGTYRFSARADDGLRVWVGDKLIVDAWRDQPADWMTRDVYLNHGVYTVRVEYYEHGGGAAAQLNWERLAAGQGWLGEYYANQNLAGAPAMVRPDGAINFAWAGGSPDPAIPADHFSVRWSRTLSFPAGAYRFHAATDDGVRLWVDDRLVVDAWYGQQLPNDRWGDLVLDDKPHRIKVEYFEDGGGAEAHVWWEPLRSFTGWRGEYYDNPDMYWPPVMIRDDAEINLDWGTAPPVDWMPDDNFTVRWTRDVVFTPGFYRIAARADDGVRVWLDGNLIVDRWPVMNNDLYYVDGTYLSGTHRFMVEYLEKNGEARIYFAVVPTPWKAEFFANPDLAGEPLFVRLYENVDFDWGYGPPGPDMPSDNFSIRWTTRQYFDRGRYTFDIISDDGVRLYLDGRLVLNSWRAMHGSNSVTRYLRAGEHTIVLEYLERTGTAMVQLNWQKRK